jgi:zinc protease
MHNLALNPAQFAKERKVVMEERRVRVDDNPLALAVERFKAVAYANGPYHHPTVGWMTDIEHLTLEDLARWYHQWYVPNNAVLIVVGDVVPEKVLALAKKYFGPITAKPLPQIKPRTEVVALGEREISVHLPAKLHWLAMGYNVPAWSSMHEKWKPYAFLALTGVLGSGKGSQFAKTLVRGKRMAINAAALYPFYRLHNTLIILEGTPTQHHSPEQLKKAFLQEVKQLQQQPVAKSELSRVITMMVADNIFTKDSLTQQAFMMGEPEMMGLSWRDSDDFITRLKAVTPQQIQVVAREYLTPNRLTTVTLYPEISTHLALEKALPFAADSLQGGLH